MTPQKEPAYWFWFQTDDRSIVTRMTSLICIELGANDEWAGGGTYKLCGTLKKKIAAYPLDRETHKISKSN